MSTAKKTIPVFFTIDNKYAPWLAVAVNSMVKNASQAYNYHIMVLHQGVTEENQKKIAALAGPGFKMDFITMADSIEGISSDFIGNKLRADYFTLTIYFRIFIPAMFPQYDKAIYLDSDIVVPGDISELYETELGDNYIAACPDYSIQEVWQMVDYTEKAIGCASSLKYINSGILLMNLEKLRQKDLGGRFLEVLQKYHFDCIAPDQDYINALCMGNIHFLPEEWDAMPNDTKKPLANPKIIHYNLFAKPWCYDNVQYGDIFWKYAKDSGFYELIRDFKDNYPEEQKASDSACAKSLFDRAAMISVKEGDTFARIFNTGKEKRL